MGNNKYVNSWKKAAALFLCVTLAFGLFRVSGIKSVSAANWNDISLPDVNGTMEATGQAYGINIGAAVLCTGAAWDTSYGMTVYYGQYDNRPMEFRVLKGSPGTQESDSESVLLDSNNVLLKLPFNAELYAGDMQASGHPNEWAGSGLEAYLGRKYKNSVDGEDDAWFSQVEAGAIAETKLKKAASYNMGKATLTDYEADNHLFLLSGKEAMSLYSGNRARKKAGSSGLWWVRSASDNNDYFAGTVVNMSVEYINVDIAGINIKAGDIAMVNINTGEAGVSPAFNLKVSSVLFTSAANGENGFVEKTFNISAGNVGATDARRWKLTLKDTDKSIKMAAGKYAGEASGGAVIVPYSYTDSNNTNKTNQISVMITDKAYNEPNARILYYGALNEIKNVDGDISTAGETTVGTGIIDMPKDLPLGYKIYMMAECVSEGNASDYASEPTEVLFPPKMPIATPPSVSGTASAEPTTTPSEEPTETPTAEPTETSSAEPIQTPTAEPSETPTEETTVSPIAGSSETPTEGAAVSPSAKPSKKMKDGGVEDKSGNDIKDTGEDGRAKIYKLPDTGDTEGIGFGILIFVCSVLMLNILAGLKRKER